MVIYLITLHKCHMKGNYCSSEGNCAMVIGKKIFIEVVLYIFMLLLQRKFIASLDTF